MKYFTFKGSFSHLYSYHIHLLMHFTRVRMLHIPYYLFRSIEKMAYIVKTRDYKQKMQSLFHHSLIKMVVMHQLQQENIPWDTLITNEVFTTPPGHHQQDIPSSSNPPISTSPSHPTVHTSPSTHIHSPHDDPSSSPFHHHSPSHHDTRASSSERDIGIAGTKMNDIDPFPLTYRRGHRHVFSSLEVKGAMPSSSEK